MSTYIPAQFFEDPIRGKNTLDILDTLYHIVPRQNSNSLVPIEDLPKLSIYNRRSLSKELKEDNIDSEIKFYVESRKKIEDIPNIINYYNKFSRINIYNNRFINKETKDISNIGVDGSGLYPDDNGKETLALIQIKKGANSVDELDSFSGVNEKIFEQNLQNLLYWPKVSMSQLPYGTPSQIASAVLFFFCPNKPSEPHNLIPEFTGRQFVDLRKECEGLKYLLDGSKEDLDSLAFNGVQIFENENFNKFYSGGSNNCFYLINYINGGNVITPLNANNYTELEPNNSAPDNTKLLGNLGNNMEQLLTGKLTFESGGGPVEHTNNNALFGILLIYSNLFLYFGYLSRIYEKLYTHLKGVVDSEKYAEYERMKIQNRKNIRLFLNRIISKYFFENLPDNVRDNLVYVNENDKVNWDNESQFNICLNNVKLKELKNKLYFRFNKVIYETEGSNIKTEKVNYKNYPLVFAENVTGPPNVKIIDYRESIQKMTKLLLSESDIPIGASMQNEEIFTSSCKTIAGFYSSLNLSKTTYLNYMQMKIDIFKSGIPSKEILDLKNYLMNNFNLINTTISTPEQKEFECIKLVDKIVNQYKKLRKEEIKLTSEKTIFSSGTRRLLGEEESDYPRQLTRAIKRLKAGTSALLRIKVAEYTYQIFMERNPGARLCNNFIPFLQEKVKKIDDAFNLELSQIILRKKAEINAKYGANKLKNVSKQLSLINFSSIPPSPQNYLTKIGSLFSSMDSRSGLSSSFSGIPGGPASGPGGPIGKNVLNMEQRLRVEQKKFWEDLRTSFSGKTLYLPVAKLRDGNIFDDSEFYLLDIINSMIFNNVIASKLSSRGKITPKSIYNNIQQKGYILFSSFSQFLGDPTKWKAVNHNSLNKLLIRRDGGIRFTKIRKSRCLFFNLIANNSFLTDSLNISIPDASNTSLALVKYCSEIIKKPLPVCNVLISRQQFSQTIQDKMQMLSGTKGINLVSGMSFAEFSEYSSISGNDIIRR